jgi:hypothetical protein
LLDRRDLLDRWDLARRARGKCQEDKRSNKRRRQRAGDSKGEAGIESQRHRS